MPCAIGEQRRLNGEAVVKRQASGRQAAGKRQAIAIDRVANKQDAVTIVFYTTDYSHHPPPYLDEDPP
jgi:hypothetical protein